MRGLLQRTGIRRERHVIGADANLAGQSVEQYPRSWIILVFHSLRCMLREVRGGFAIPRGGVEDVDRKTDGDECRGWVASQQDVDLAGGPLDGSHGLVSLVCSDGIDRFLSFRDGSHGFLIQILGSLLLCLLALLFDLRSRLLLSLLPLFLQVRRRLRLVLGLRRRVNRRILARVLGRTTRSQR